MKKRLWMPFAMFALAMVVLVSPAMAFEFQSTNDANKTAYPHVNLLSTGPGTVTLEFVNPRPFYAFFEYRIDGITPEGRPAHEIVIGDVQYPGVGLDNRGAATEMRVTRTFEAASRVEIRHALGAEQDWYFDWVTFTVGPVGPTDPASKEDCMNGGWEAMGFANQGQCIRYVNTGVDSREP
jgi:hypothetical protein